MENWLEANKNISRTRGRRNSYYSNILIVSDPQNKENEGKVFIYRFGKTVYDMYMGKVSPEEGSIEEKVRVYDYDAGLNFKLKIKPKKTGKKSHNDYSGSTFVETVTAIAETDEEIDAIDAMLHPLQQIITPDKFNEYNVIEAKFLDKIGEKQIEKPSETEEIKEKDSTGDVSNETTSTDEQSPDSFFESLQEQE